MAAKKSGSKRITSLADMAALAVEYDVEIEHEGDVLIIPCKMLSYTEWQTAGLRVQDPAPPVQGVDKRGQPVLDRNDAGYLAARAKAADLRAALRLAQFVQIEIDGKTPEEQAESIMETLPPAVFNKLLQAMSAAYEGRAVRVLARAETFPADGNANIEGAEGA